jgi:hypothetical protein
VDKPDGEVDVREVDMDVVFPLSTMALVYSCQAVLLYLALQEIQLYNKREKTKVIYSIYNEYREHSPQRTKH